MKAKLIKKNEHYFLETQPYTLSNLQRHTITANTFDKPKGHILQLSLKNCQAIERGYDLDELSENHAEEVYSREDYEPHHFENRKKNFEDGFQKALELMGDKKFSEDDVIKAIIGFYMDDKILIESNINKQIQSLQQTEWDVEIEMEGFVDEEGIYCGERPKLDADGCLILKLKSE